MITARPILFSAPMIRALLTGTKTQTRRLAKFAPLREDLNLSFSGLTATRLRTNGTPDGVWLLQSRGRSCWEDRSKPLRCPYGVPGDLLWVRETTVIAPPMWTDSPVNPRGPHRQETAYLADNDCMDAANDYGLKKTPSIFMPRWASRLTLELTDVRIERLQDISEADAMAEGIEHAVRPFGDWKLIPGIWNVDALSTGVNTTEPPPAIKYAYLWNQINTDDGNRWADNPWVWALSFRVHQVNVDAFLSAVGASGRLAERVSDAPNKGEAA